MPDITYMTVKEVTQPARLVAVSTVTTKIETVSIKPDGTCVQHEPQVRTETIEKWSVKAIVDQDWVGVKEEEFFFPSETACSVIQPGYKQAF